MCMRIGSRHNVNCVNIRTVSAREILHGAIKLNTWESISLHRESLNDRMIMLNASFIEPLMQSLAKLDVLLQKRL